MWRCSQSSVHFCLAPVKTLILSCVAFHLEMAARPASLEAWGSQVPLPLQVQLLSPVPRAAFVRDAPFLGMVSHGWDLPMRGTRRQQSLKINLQNEAIGPALSARPLPLCEHLVWHSHQPTG